jgi:hypothetical protein
MSDERRWKLTGVHGNPVALRLANSHGPQFPGPDEVIEVVEVAALARVERERDEAEEALEHALNRGNDFAGRLAMAAAQRDALRAQVKALTGERAIEAASNVIVSHTWRGLPDEANYVSRKALAAARDAAAAKAPDDPLR